jgi:hypothetical protein
MGRYACLPHLLCFPSPAVVAMILFCFEDVCVFPHPSHLCFMLGSFLVFPDLFPFWQYAPGTGHLECLDCPPEWEPQCEDCLSNGDLVVREGWCKVNHGGGRACVTVGTTRANLMVTNGEVVDDVNFACARCEPQRSNAVFSAAEGTRCDDGDATTGGDSCTDGICEGSPLNCLSCQIPSGEAGCLSNPSAGCVFEGPFAASCGCNIRGVCHAPGTLRTDLPCQVCDSSLPCCTPPLTPLPFPPLPSPSLLFSRFLFHLLEPNTLLLLCPHFSAGV